MSEFLQYQDQTSQFYSDLMNKLERMNSTLGVMLHYMDNMQSHIEERLHMIQGYLGWAGFSRAMLLLTVPLNAVAEVNQQPALDLCSLSLLLFTLSLAHMFVSKLWATFQTKRNPATLILMASCDMVEPQKQPYSSCTTYPPSSTPQNSLSGRQLCNGITKTGKTCKKRAVPGQEYCRVHEGGHSTLVHS
ncbi:Protein brambleberry Precursor [Channa argus]|uniref:Protein brambleberry n=1 Tax=Channa argus TaxID=215402 RepID=A0A6G1PJK5_CHAAH|nr:Protein brambleberry Precursor [Channa argus]